MWLICPRTIQWPTTNLKLPKDCSFCQRIKAVHTLSHYSIQLEKWPFSPPCASINCTVQVWRCMRLLGRFLKDSYWLFPCNIKATVHQGGVWDLWRFDIITHLLFQILLVTRTWIVHRRETLAIKFDKNILWLTGTCLNFGLFIYFELWHEDFILIIWLHT